MALSAQNRLYRAFSTCAKVNNELTKKVEDVTCWDICNTREL